MNKSDKRDLEKIIIWGLLTLLMFAQAAQSYYLVNHTH